MIGYHTVEGGEKKSRWDKFLLALFLAQFPFYRSKVDANNYLTNWSNLNKSTKS